MHRKSVSVWLLAILQLWLAHALGYMVHEYAHSFMAYILHAKANPLALDYGGLNLDNLLFLNDIDENVDYAPLFAAGRYHAAALISVAGVLIGNGLSYLVSLYFYRLAQVRNRRSWGMFFFWLGVMSVGNFLSYVPIRTFASHADMSTVVRGLDTSPWVIAIALGIPFALAIWHYLWIVLPEAEAFLFGEEPVLQGVLVLMTTYFVFVFFGGSGLKNYGAAGYWLSATCEYLLFPVATILCLQRSRAKSRHLAA
jgi:hypothetical protein